MQKIERNKKIGSDYSQGKLVMSDWRNFKSIQAELYDSLNKKSDAEMKIILSDNNILYRDNREYMKTLFGEPTFYFRGEFYSHCHLFIYKEKKFLVVTAKGRGTSYEVQSDIKPEEQHLIKEFVNEIKKLLSQWKSNRV